MFRSGLCVLTVAACGWGILAGSTVAQSPAAVTVLPELGYRITTLTINGSANCAGGGVASVTVVDSSLEQMFQGDIGGPIAVQLDGPVLIDCDGAQQDWSGNLYAPGHALPTNSGGTVTVNLNQGPVIIATTGPQLVRIVN
ncbi:hypothetical protein BGZ93_002806 [Podila epicladia]|nr:hypothetical protein BGZ93_002806 [Podila epicladia]KAG0085849.1 hypothetical protein BGZ92_008649 [Podila epicladia]